MAGRRPPGTSGSSGSWETQLFWPGSFLGGSPRGARPPHRDVVDDRHQLGRRRYRLVGNSAFVPGGWSPQDTELLTGHFPRILFAASGPVWPGKSLITQAIHVPPGPVPSPILTVPSAASIAAPPTTRMHRTPEHSVGIYSSHATHGGAAPGHLGAAMNREGAERGTPHHARIGLPRRPSRPPEPGRQRYRPRIH